MDQMLLRAGIPHELLDSHLLGPTKVMLAGKDCSKIVIVASYPGLAAVEKSRPRFVSMAERKKSERGRPGYSTRLLLV